jgi:pyridoxamine 5'-phosphate oxidase
MDRIRSLRVDYESAGLDLADCDPDPLGQFERWFGQAVDAGLYEPNAMVLSTADAMGAPASRAVLMKAFDPTGFVFFTNYDSAKGSQLAVNPRAALLFLWLPLHRQVRIEGVASRVPEAESDEYFASRPLQARHGAVASPQSRSIPDRTWLERRVEEAARTFGEEVTRPPAWGGYRVTPHRFEFWQGRPSRLHDRIRYDRVEGDWLRCRLAP